MLTPGLHPILRWWSKLPLRAKGLMVVSISLCASLFTFVLSFLVDLEQDEATRLVECSTEARFEADKVLDRVSEAERAANAYAIVRNEELLEPYRAVPTLVQAGVARLSRVLANEASQTARLRRVQSAVNAEIALLKQRVDAIEQRAPGDLAAQSNEARRGMAALRREIGVFDEEERRLLSERSGHLARVEAWRTVTDGGGVLVEFLSALVAVQLFSLGIVHRMQLLRENADRLAEGTALVAFPPGEDEIGILARHLEKAARLLAEQHQTLAATMLHLRKSEELYRAIAHNFPNGSIYLVDGNLRYLVADGSELAKIGLSRATMEGQTIWEALPAEIAGRLEPLFRATLQGEEREEEFLYGDRLYQLQCLPLRDETGTIYAGLLITQNISERKRHEEALRLARDEAERANRAKSQFLSRMSHELRTPLNAILGFGQVLELSALPDQSSECVRHVLKGGRHLLTLVDEVLDLARVEAGELRLKPSAVRLDELAHECIGFMTTMMRKREITCTIEDSSAFQIPVWADKHRLRQVVLNLISNATKYNREEGRITLACSLTPEGRVRFEVGDTGRGMSADDLARLFVPFERLGQEHGGVEGTGLGLVVSKQLMDAMNGSLGASSAVDGGTTFWIELPAMKAALAPVENAASASVALVESVGGESATVLYIEDNLSNLGVVRMLISRLRPHWRFLEAHDGCSGVKMAREERPNCILLDLQLPGMNGDLVLAELRADEVTRRIPVLLVSADIMTHSRAALLAFGATDYLPKPFEVADLLGKLDQYIVSHCEV